MMTHTFTITYSSHKTTRGFSLVELMVALTIFSIVMTIALGTILIMVDASAKAQAVSSSVTNLTFAIDTMTRNIRTGKDFYCPTGTNLTSINNNSVSTLHTAPYNAEGDCAAGSSVIIFTPGFENTTRMAYRRNVTTGTIDQWIDENGVADSWVPITSSSTVPAGVDITRLRFVATDTLHTDGGNYRQPRISLLVEGAVDNGLDTPTEFAVQSVVGQRILDLF